MFFPPQSNENQALCCKEIQENMRYSGLLIIEQLYSSLDRQTDTHTHTTYQPSRTCESI